MKTIIFLFITNIAFAQYFAPSLTTIYQDNSKQPGQRYGVDLKYFSIHYDKELFFGMTYAFGENAYSDSDLFRMSIGCKTGEKLKYGAMASAIGYRIANYPESEKDQYTGAISFSPLVSYDINKYFYVEAGMTLTGFQKGDFEVMNSYFASIGMRWW